MLKSSIATKIILLTLSLVLVSSIIIGAIGIYKDSGLRMSSKILEKRNEIQLLSVLLKSKIEELRNDASLLSSTPPVEGLIRADSNAGIDPKDGSTSKQWKDRIAIIFEEVLHAKSNYAKIRFIGNKDDKKELVRVERIDSKIFRTKNEDLQKGSEHTFLEESIAVGPGRVFLSQITFDRDFGKINQPPELHLRAVVPVFKNRRTPFGFIVINLSYSKIINAIIRRADESTKYFITNQKGSILYHSDENYSRTEGIDSQNYVQDLFQETNTFLKSSTDVFSSGTQKNKDHLIIAQKVHYDKLNFENFIGLFTLNSKDAIQKEIYSEVINYFFIIFSILFISVTFSFIFSRYLTKPLIKLTEFVTHLASGGRINEQLDLEINSKDEIGTLANTLVSMSRDLRIKDSALKSQKDALDNSAIVVETDIQGKIIYVNDKFLQISGYSRRELMGVDHRILNSGYHSKDFFINLWETIKSGKTWRGEIKNKAKSGHYYWVDTTIYPNYSADGELEKFIAIRFDITSRKKAEIELQQAKENAERTAKFKTDFLANMSHEIRTPISGIIGMNNFLMESGLTEQQKDYAENIRLSSETLLVVINDILDLSKIEAGKLDLEQHAFKLNEIIDQVLFMIRGKAEEKNLKLEYSLSSELPDIIFADSTRLKQILINLINNAIKFTERGSVFISVSASVLNQTDVKIKFNVRDSGIGIPEEKLGQIFDSFSQAESSTSRKYGGTGLGLSICQKLVELMGGKIWVESDYGVGSSFYFTIEAKVGNKRDLKEKTEDAVLSNVTNLAEAYRYNILVAEDNLINQKIVLTLLDGLGYQADLAEDGYIAVEKATEQNYDLIFMDIQMPNLDGIEALKKIRKIYEQRKKPQPWVIALTANVFKEDKEKYFKEGFDDFLPKPLAREMIYSAIVGMTNGKSSLKAEFSQANLSQTKLNPLRIVNDGKIIDQSRIDSLLEMDPSVFIEVVDSFLEELPEKLSDIERAISEKNTKQIERVCHNLKGAAANIGAVDLMDKCQQLETKSEKGDSAEFNQALDSIKTSATNTRNHLESVIQELKKAA